MIDRKHLSSLCFFEFGETFPVIVFKDINLKNCFFK